MSAAPTASVERTIAIIPKNSREDLRIGLSTWKGVELINLRVWFDVGNGEKRPGKSGLAMKISALPELAAAIGKALEQARADGLI